MAAVFSSRFIQEPSFSGGPSSPVVVPAKFVWVVRNISIVWGDVTVSGLDAWVQDDSGAKLFRRTISVAIQDYLDSGGADSVEGRWTYGAGETLQVQTTSGTCDFLVSGYSLALP